MRKLIRSGACVGAELRAISSLIPVLVVSLLAVLALSMGGVAMAYPSFQSPVSPLPAASPTAEAPLAPSPEPSAPTAAPTETPTILPESPAPSVEPETPAPPTEEPPTVEAEETPASVGTPSPLSTVRWATIIDAILVGVSYLWLCLGAIVLTLFVLGVVLSFVVRRM